MSFITGEIAHAASGKIIQSDDLMTSPDKEIDQMASDKSCTAGYQTTHDSPSL
jgi:hypothetical protein